MTPPWEPTNYYEVVLPWDLPQWEESMEKQHFDEQTETTGHPRSWKEVNTAFYVVMRDRADTHITKRHATQGEAQREADRLCRKEGGRFFVLRATLSIERPDWPLNHQILEG